MRCLLMFVAASVVASGFAVGREPTQPNEHLKGFGPFIGTWRYEGPLPEEVPGVMKKGSKCTVQFSWRWILDKQAVMQDLKVEFEGDKRVSLKELIGWNAADQELVIGGVISIGGVELGTIHLDPRAKTLTVETKGVNAEGGKTTSKSVFTKVDRDTMTFKRLESTGNIVEGPSPIYELTRVKRDKGKKAPK